MLQSLQVPRVFLALSSGEGVFGDDDGEVPSSWIMVLLLKQVHLQKEVAAIRSLVNLLPKCHSKNIRRFSDWR